MHKKHLYIPHKSACKVKYIKCNRKGTVTNSKAEKKRSKKGNNMQKTLKFMISIKIKFIASNSNFNLSFELQNSHWVNFESSCDNQYPINKKQNKCPLK